MAQQAYSSEVLPDTAKLRREHLSPSVLDPWWEMALKTLGRGGLNTFEFLAGKTKEEQALSGILGIADVGVMTMTNPLRNRQFRENMLKVFDRQVKRFEGPTRQALEEFRKRFPFQAASFMHRKGQIQPDPLGPTRPTRRSGAYEPGGSMYQYNKRTGRVLRSPQANPGYHASLVDKPKITLATDESYKNYQGNPLGAYEPTHAVSAGDPLNRASTVFHEFTHAGQALADPQHPRRSTGIYSPVEVGARKAAYNQVRKAQDRGVRFFDEPAQRFKPAPRTKPAVQEAPRGPVLKAPGVSQAVRDLKRLGIFDFLTKLGNPPKP